MNAAPAPIFVLAAPYCHGNQVCAMLGQHPALFGLPSLHLFSQPTLGELLTWFDGHPRLAAGLLRTVAHLFFGGQAPEAIASARKWLDARRHRPPSEVLVAIDHALSGRRIVEWSFSTAHPQALARLAEACPQARFIHALCDPSSHRRSVIADRRQRGLEMPSDPDRFWLAPNLAIFEFVQSLPWQRRIQLQVEMLATTPQETLRQLLTWLELPCNHSFLDAMLKPELSPFAGPDPSHAEGTGDTPPSPVVSRSRFLEEVQQAGDDDAGLALGQLADSTRLFAARWNYCFDPNH